MFKSPAFWSISVLCLALVAHHFYGDKEPELPKSKVWHQLPPSDGTGKGWLIKPFLTPREELGIALDGGEIPLFLHDFPELRFGAESERPLHLVLIVSWEAETTRRQLAAIYQLYQSDSAASLPPLVTSLLPVTSTPEHREIDHMIYKVFAMSSQLETFPSLIQSVSAKNEPPTLEAIDAFLKENKPDLLDRIRAAPHVMDDKLEIVSSAASRQALRSRALFDIDGPQLISMNQSLNVAPNQAELSAFLSAAKNFQDAYLASPMGMSPISPGFGCRCDDPSHPHEPWKIVILERFPELQTLPKLDFDPPEIPSDNPDPDRAPGGP